MEDSARLRLLAADLCTEREALERIAGEAARCLSDLWDRAPSYLELRGAGDVVHDFYNEVERFFERVAVEMNGGLPAGPDSHGQLLQRMSRGVDGVRPAVIDQELRERLQEYLRFRHLFRHRYGFELEWPRIVPLLRGMGDLAPALDLRMGAFIAEVSSLADRLE